MSEWLFKIITLVTYHLISLCSLPCFHAAEVPLSLPQLWSQLLTLFLHQCCHACSRPPEPTRVCKACREPQVGGMVTPKGFFFLLQLIPEGFS